MIVSPEDTSFDKNYSPRVFTFEGKTIIRILNNEPSLILLDYVDDVFGSFGTTSIPRRKIQMKTNILLTELTMCVFPLNSKFEVSTQNFCILGCWTFLEEQRLFPKVTQMWKIVKVLLDFVQQNNLDIQIV